MTTHKRLGTKKVLLPIISTIALSAGVNASPLELPRINNFDELLARSYDGAFALGNYGVSPHPEVSAVTSYSGVIYNEAFASTAGAFAFHSDGETFFYSGADGAWNGDGGLSGSNAGKADSITQFRIPSLTKNDDINDRSGYQTAEQLQPWSAVFKDANGLIQTDDNSGAHAITGLHYDTLTGKLCMTVMQQYDVGPGYTQDNMLCYRNPSDLSASPVDGYYSMLAEDADIYDAAHAATWIADVPTQWQSTLGGRTLFGGGANASIISRLPAGLTLFTGDLTGLPDNGRVTINRHMDFWDLPGKQMGAYLYPGRVTSGSSWYQHEYMNCDRTKSDYDCGQPTTESNLVVPWINDWFNILSYGAQGFILPNTRTYVVIGTMDAAEGGASYKGWPEWRSSRCTGPCRVVQDDQYNKYWLFDIAEILEASNPWEIMPYEHGYIDFLDQAQTKDGGRSRLVNAGFDLATGRLAIVMRNRHGSFEPKSDIFMFSNEAWREDSEIIPLPSAPPAARVNVREE